uniref:RING-type E3 ubiquitin transferase n=1 Tax=Varanus komodoensis TaxID=61221 RepID=A0A8D2LML1_VARKO
MASLNEELNSDNTRSGFRSPSGGSLVKVMPGGMAKSSTCAICLEGIQDKTYLNPCNHKFCFDCIQKWSRKKVLCPLCKDGCRSNRLINEQACMYLITEQ